MARSGAPFVKYDVAGFYELLCGSVHKTERTALLGEPEEDVGHGTGGELAPYLFGYMDMCYAAKNLELQDVWFHSCVLLSRGGA
jgi:hypothetical protein